jgi:mannitol/fructose-specific phosphotransferase system IIA component (Ntr-type)
LKLHHLLTEDMILMNLEAPTRDLALKNMVGFLKDRKRINKEKDIYDKLVQREDLGTTAVGGGVAIPHCKITGLKSPILMLALSKAGISFSSLDGKPSQAFFLVASSPDNPGLSLQILAAIAQLVRKSGSLTAKLLDAPDPRGVLRVLREHEERAHG